MVKGAPSHAYEASQRANLKDSAAMSLRVNLTIECYGLEQVGQRSALEMDDSYPFRDVHRPPEQDIELISSL
jgi:hypothetical protein